MPEKNLFNREQCNQMITSLLHTLTLLPNPFYLPLLSHSFIHPKKPTHAQL